MNLKVKGYMLGAVMGLLMAVSSYTLFESYNHIDVGIASTLLFVYPIMRKYELAGIYHLFFKTISCKLVNAVFVIL